MNRRTEALMMVFAALMLAGLLPISGCIDAALKPLIGIIEYPEIEHQKQLRAKLPRPEPLIDPYQPQPSTRP